MIIQSGKKMVFGITGMPRSGTTLVGNIFNSAENSFCFCEPHWIILRNEKEKLTFDKVNDFNFKDIGDIMPSVERTVRSCGEYDLGGVKETWSSSRPESFEFVEKYNVDFLIFVFREPKSFYNRMKFFSTIEKNNLDPSNVDQFIYEYNLIYDKVEYWKSRKPTFVISFNKLCEKSNNKEYIVSYFNSMFNEFLYMDGEFELKKTNYHYGNPVAHSITEIKASKNDTDLLLDDEIYKIEKSVEEIYREIL